MFTRLSSSGGRTYLQIVEAYRSKSGATHQRLIANLGRLDKLEQRNLDPLINGLNRALGRAANPAGAVEYESARAVGDVYVLQQLWGELGFARAVRRALRSSRREFDAKATVRTIVLCRLCEPESKLGVLRWLETVAIADMPETVSHDHLLRTMDLLSEQAEAIDQIVSQLVRPLIDQEISVVFYDLTTVPIHGEAEVAGDVHQFAMFKQTGGVARQFVLGLVQTSDGLPLMHTVHPGNFGELSTLRPMLEEVVKRVAVQRVVLVADPDLLSLENIAQLEAIAEIYSNRRIDFILAVLARHYGESGDTLEQPAFVDGLAEARSAEHRLVVAHDPQRAAEQAARRRVRIAELERFAQRLVAKLDAQDEGQTERERRATDRGAYSRFARALADADLTRFVRADYQAERFSYDIDEEPIGDAERFDGKLVLLTSVADMPAVQIVERYKSLADIERSFRVLKSDNEFAPVFHRLPQRIRAHAQICYLALLLYRVMHIHLRAQDNPHSPTAALKLLSRIQSHQTRIGEHSFRGLSRMSAEQLDLFKDVGIAKSIGKALW